MTPEEKALLQHVTAVAEENNAILKGIRRSQRIGRLFSIFYWLIIIGISLGAYIIIQPYLDKVTGAYNGAQSDLQSMSKIFNSFKNSSTTK